MQLHNLTTSSGVTKTRRIGRGGKRGKTSGKGTKGQKSRAGHKIRPAMRDVIKRIPKRRGYGVNRSRTVNPSKVKPRVVNLAALEASFDDGARVEPRALVAKGVVRGARGRAPAVKILGVGKLTKKLTVVNCEISAAAKEVVLKAGGSVL